MKNPVSSIYEKYPRLFAFIVVAVLAVSFYAVKFYVHDRYDASRFPQFELHRDMTDSGEYIEEDAFSRAHQKEDYYGKRIVLEVKPGPAEEEKGVYWYPSAEFSGEKSNYMLYSEEVLPEEAQTDFMRAECLLTGYYSVPTGQAIRVAVGGYILKILDVTSREGSD